MRLRNPKDRFAGAEQIESRESTPDAGGRITRTRLLRTDFKYPLVRVEETVTKDTQTGEETLIKQSAMVGDHIMVKVRPETSAAQIDEVARKHGGQVLRKMSAPNLYLVEFPGAGIDAVPKGIQALVQESNAVVNAEPNFIGQALDTLPTDAMFSGQWALQNTGQNGGTAGADIHAPGAWDISRGNTNVLVAVLDTGIDYNHPDLAANIWINPGEAGILSTNALDDDGNGYTNDFRGWNFVSTTNNAMDGNGHGTHCAGIIGAVGNNGLGVAGVCWNVSLVGLEVIGGGEDVPLAETIEAIDYAGKIGARVLSISLGWRDYSTNLFTTIQSAATKNILVVAAAGNDGCNNDRITSSGPIYPASYSNANIIAVASSTHNDELSYFSNYGSNSVDIVAPGSDIFSCWPSNLTSDGRAYLEKSGTSMACPYVAGCAALLLAHNPSLTFAEVKSALMNSVDTNAAFAGKVVSNGRLNVNRAIRNVKGIYFDKPQYFAGTCANVTLVNPALAGTGTQSVSLSTSAGDSESLTMYETTTNGIFTNCVFISLGSSPTNGNGWLEGVHDTELRVAFTSAALGVTNLGTAQINHALQFVITTPPQYVPLQMTDFSINGINNGNVFVTMMISNSATGDAVFFTATNDWTAPPVTITSGTNIIWVLGTNTYGFTFVGSVSLIRVGPSGVTNYVSLAGTNVWPYTSWTTAATNLQAAIAAACPGNIVLVSNGTYNCSASIVIDRDITVCSLSGTDQTIIDGRSAVRCFVLRSPNAVLTGFTITNGYASSPPYGGGVLIETNGIVKGCVITRCRAASGGGGLCCLSGGTIDQCTIISNSAGKGGGVYVESVGSIQNCIVRNNDTAGTLVGRGAGVYCSRGGILRNCAIYRNQADEYYGAYGGGVYLDLGGEIQNCTIADNYADNDGGGVEWVHGGLIANTIISFNVPNSAGGVYSNCFSGDPLFMNHEANDYRLLPGSPCMNAGTNQNWMIGATDLDGNERIIGSSVDIGAYEFKPGALQCNATANQFSGIEPLTVVFTGYVAGTNTDGLWYAWDFENDGITDTSGVGITVVTNTYWGAGFRSVSLTVSNAVGEVTGITKSNYIQVLPVPLVVSSLWGTVVPPRGTSAFSYGSNVYCSVLDSPVPNGVTTQYCCTGWRGTGSVPTNGTSTNVAIVLTNSSSIVWNWQTQYLFTATAGLNGDVIATNGWYDQGSNVVAFAVASNGYHFAFWSNDVPVSGQTSNPVTLSMSQARSITAIFEANMNLYALVVTSPFGIVTPNRGTNYFTYGSNVECAVLDSPVAGGAGTQYVGKGWTGTGSVPAAGTNTNVVVTLVGDSSLTWNWKTQYLFTATTALGGVVVPSNAWCDASTPLSVTGVPNTGYRFAQWSGDDVPTNKLRDNPLSLTMGAPRTVTAQFVSNVVYVSLGGSHIYPYTDWGTAATNIQVAVDVVANGGLVLVTNGTYQLTKEIAVTNGITIRSVNGPNVTVVDGGYPSRTNRCFFLDKSNAVVDGFTIRNGRSSVGGGVFFHQFQACAVRNSIIVSNSSSGSGGGVSLWGPGLLENCLITGNQATDKGGGVYFYYNPGGGKARNCTIVSNRAENRGGGVYLDCGGDVENGIIYYNTAPNDSNYYSCYQLSLTSSCTLPLPFMSGVGNITNEPAFVNPAAGDYHLSAGSPCINAGTNRTWMVGAMDLDGFDRILNGRVDIGAYEYMLPSITPVLEGTNLRLSWPANCLGWELQFRTNSLNVCLGTNWFPVPGSTNNTQMSIPINPASPSVFYRLHYQ
jgi:parallel beta-helix repeat protein